MKLILASGSPRRAEILRRAGFIFDALETRIEEVHRTGESPEAYVQRLAIAKARAAADDLIDWAETTFIVGADTTVVVAGEMFEKPVDTIDARRMLRLLSHHRTHDVLTGISVIVLPEGQSVNFVERTRVEFSELSEAEIEKYIATGEAFGKAGAYAIQGYAGRYVGRVEGCYFNVMGLPLSRVWNAMLSLGWTDSAP
ncbi:MAG TPA: Maf family protein [Candidatus Acidoferrum sp.]|nr:Maf family protein [Candidatus Acidoferrum sp.]